MSVVLVVELSGSVCGTPFSVIQGLGIYTLLPSIRNMAGVTQGTLKDRALAIAKKCGIAHVRDFDAGAFRTPI